MYSTVALVTFFVVLFIEESLQTTCYDSKGQPLCDKSKCPANLHCKGNIALDNCGCCKVCLKQENELCGGPRNQYGRCDHHAKYCETFDGTRETRCMTLATALALKKVKYIRQLKECKVPKGVKKRSVEKMLLCLIKEGNPTYFCRKEPEYNLEDCCINSTGCNPHKKTYKKLPIPVFVKALIQPLTENQRIAKQNQHDIATMRKKIETLKSMI